SGQYRGALTRLEDLLQVLPERVAGADVFEHQLRVADDRGEQIVEVVSDPAREPPDSLHFLSSEQLILRVLQLRDVFGDPHDARHLAGRIAHRRRAAANPADRSVRPGYAERVDALIL